MYSIHYLDFPFEKHETFQILKDFSVENLNLFPALFSRSFLLRSMYLDLLITEVVFLHYTQCE